MRKHKILIALLFTIISSYSQDRHVLKDIDSLKNLLKKEKIDTSKVNILNQIGDNYNYVRDSSSLVFAKKSLFIAKKINYKKGLIDAYKVLGKFYYNNYDSENTLIFYNKAKSLCIEIKDNTRLARIYNSIGNTYMNLNNYSMALSNYIEASIINENMNNLSNLAGNYSNIADIYLSLNSEKKFLKYVKLSTEIAVKLNDFNLQSFNYEMYVKYYLDKKDYKQAGMYAKKVITISEKTDDTNSMAVGNIALGVVAEKLKKFDLALLHFKDGIKFHKISNNILGIASSYNEVGKCYFNYYNHNKSQENLELATFNFLESNKIYATENLIDGLMENYYYLSKIYEIKKIFNKSLYFHKEYLKYKDSIFNSSTKETIKNIEDRHTIAIKNNQIKINKLEIREKEKQKWFYLFGIGLLAIIGGLLFYQSRNRKKTNEKLQLLNAELDQANKTKTRFFSILNHDLRSPVANLIHFLHLQKDSPELLDEETKNRMQNKTISGAEDLLSSMEDILLWSKGQMENFKPQPKNVSINQLFEDTKKVFSGYQKIDFDYQNPDNISIFTDENYLKTIVRNLTSNAINVFTTTQNPKITWKAWQENNVSYLSVTDNGPGASKEQFKALYDDKEVVGIKTGLGLHLIRDLAKAIDCEIKVNSIVNEGTTFDLLFSKQL